MNLRRRFTGAINALFGRSLQWDAAGGGNRLAQWRAVPMGVNAWLSNPALLRARAEDSYRNNPLARKAVDGMASAIVGAAGILPSLAPDGIKRRFCEWADGCDAGGRGGLVELENQVLRTVITSGECFVILGIDPDRQHPLTTQVLGPEFLDAARIDKRTFEGIEFDGPRRSAYWLFDHAPSPTVVGLKSTRWSAGNILHIFRDTHAGAQRGASWLAPALLPMRELQEFLDAALVKQKVASLFAGFLTSLDGQDPLGTSTSTPTLEPGSMFRLKAGESVDFSEPPTNPSDFDAFMAWQLRRVAAALGIPYEVLTGDHSRVTFASGRHGLLEWQRQVELVQHTILVPQLCAPLFRRWAEIAAALGMVPDNVPMPRWIGPRIAMLDPQAETTAQIMRVRAGFTPRSEVVSMDGWSIEDIDREIAADNARADRLGLVLDTDPRNTTMQGLQQQKPQQQETQPQ